MFSDMIENNYELTRKLLAYHIVPQKITQAFKSSLRIPSLHSGYRLSVKCTRDGVSLISSLFTIISVNIGLIN